MKYLIEILNWIAACTLFAIIMSVSVYLIDAKIVQFRLDFFLYFYYFGCGVLAWHPCNYLLNYHKK